MKYMNKLLAWFLMLSMLTGMVSAVAYAGGDGLQEDIQQETSEEEFEIQKELQEEIQQEFSQEVEENTEEITEEVTEISEEVSSDTEEGKINNPESGELGEFIEEINQKEETEKTENDTKTELYTELEPEEEETEKEEISVCTLNDTEYASVGAAIEAAGAGETVFFTTAVTEDITVSEGQDVILDMQHFMLKGDVTVFGKLRMKNARVEGSITVSGGELILENGIYAAGDISAYVAEGYELTEKNGYSFVMPVQESENDAALANTNDGTPNGNLQDEINDAASDAEITVPAEITDTEISITGKTIILKLNGNHELNIKLENAVLTISSESGAQLTGNITMSADSTLNCSGSAVINITGGSVKGTLPSSGVSLRGGLYSDPNCANLCASGYYAASTELTELKDNYPYAVIGIESDASASKSTESGTVTLAGLDSFATDEAIKKELAGKAAEYLDKGVCFTVTMEAKQTLSTNGTLSFDVSPVASASCGSEREPLKGESSSPVLVTLPVGDLIPDVITHTFSDNSGTEIFACGDKEKTGEFSFDTEAKTVSFYVKKFSSFSIAAAEINKPVVVTETLPNGMTGEEYYVQLEANTTLVDWTVEGLPEGLTIDEDKDKISGTPTKAGTYTVTVIAHNITGQSPEKQLTLVIADPVAETGGKKYASFEEAQAAANPGATIKLLSDIPGDITISKIITLDGAGHSVNSIAVDANNTAAIHDVKAKQIVCGENSSVMLYGDNNVDKVISSGNFVRIRSGYYGDLQGRGYSVIGGTFGRDLPFGWCREMDGSNLKAQYRTRYSMTARAYVVEEFRLDITSITNHAYHTVGTSSTISFTLNLPYDYASPSGIYIKLRDSNTSAKAVGAGGFTVSRDGNGYTVITLKSGYLNELPLGRYIFYYTDYYQYKDTNGNPTGQAAAYFTISNLIRTGDTANMALWIGLMAAALLGIGAAAGYVIVKRRKNR